jgi:hypothetical protein
MYQQVERELNRPEDNIFHTYMKLFPRLFEMTVDNTDHILQSSAYHSDYSLFTIAFGDNFVYLDEYGDSKQGESWAISMFEKTLKQLSSVIDNFKWGTCHLNNAIRIHDSISPWIASKRAPLVYENDGYDDDNIRHDWQLSPVYKEGVVISGFADTPIHRHVTSDKNRFNHLQDTSPCDYIYAVDFDEVWDKTGNYVYYSTDKDGSNYAAS